MTDTLTVAQLDSITAYITDHDLVHGMGTAEAACSISSINLALTGVLTDEVPDCMSEVIGVIRAGRIVSAASYAALLRALVR